MSARTRVIRFNHQEIEDLLDCIGTVAGRLPKEEARRKRLDALAERVAYWFNIERARETRRIVKQ